MKNHPKKRLDLQAIRGIAIIAVLGFHFYPAVFPNGYLGVDLFFVLSGFLMHMLLSRSTPLGPCSLSLHFLVRRFKRILPLYSLLILSTLLSMLHLRFPSDAALEQNRKSATRALVFVSNRRHTDEEHYFDKLRLGVDLFTHTWSLSVEMQFYLLCPFIFLAARYMDGFRCAFYIFIGYLSFIYQFTLQIDDRFNSTFSRIWQFMIGFVVYQIDSYKDEDEKEDVEKLKLLESQHPELEVDENQNPIVKKHHKFHVFSRFFFLLLTLICLFSPYPLPDTFIRPLFTLSSGILMLFSSSDTFLLTSRFLTYSGDISYALYLIHWPILAYLRLQEKDYVIISGLLLSILTSIIVFELFEKWHLKLPTLSSALLVLAFTAFSVILLSSTSPERNLIAIGNTSQFDLDGVTDNMTMDDAVIKNEYWNRKDVYTPEMVEPGCVRRRGIKTEYEWCDYQENGTEFKIAIIGNSYVQNHAKMIIQECRHRALNISLNWLPACEPLVHTNLDGYPCTSAPLNFVEFLAATQPDFVFMMTRHISVSDPFTNGGLEGDVRYGQMKEQLRKMMPNIKKKMFIMDSFPDIVNGRMETVVEDIRGGMSFEEISKRMVTDTVFQRGRTRHAALMKECGDKCELIDYYPLFLNTTSPTAPFTQYFDARGFIYLTSHHHLSAHGLDFVRPIYTDICKNMK